MSEPRCAYNPRLWSSHVRNQATFRGRFWCATSFSANRMQACEPVASLDQPAHRFACKCFHQHRHLSVAHLLTRLNAARNHPVTLRTKSFADAEYSSNRLIFLTFLTKLRQISEILLLVLRVAERKPRTAPRVTLAVIPRANPRKPHIIPAAAPTTPAAAPTSIA